MFILKISHESDLRRIALQSLPTFEILSGMVQNMFAFEGSPSIFYIDDEGDEIILKTDLELSEAFRLCSQEEPVVLRLYARGVVIEEMQSSTQPLPSPAPASDEPVSQDLLVLSNLQLQFERVMSVITEFFADDVQHHFVECKGMFETVVRSCDEQFKVASGKCQEQFQTLKTMVADLHSFNFEQQIKKLKDEFMRLTSQLRSRLLPAQPSPPVAQEAAEAVTTEVHPIQPSEPVSPPIVVSNDFAPIYPSLMREEEKKELAASSEMSASLPPDAALRDLALLEGMGFLNRKKNLELLAKHKGDVVSVVEALLADEQ